MFNTFDEHLFVCQSLLKEQRRPPTGGLREALKEKSGGSCRSLFSCCGDHKRAYFDRVRNPESLEVPFLRWKSFPSFTS